jgi:hypothetical protein
VILSSSVQRMASGLLLVACVAFAACDRKPAQPPSPATAAELAPAIDSPSVAEPAAANPASVT